LAPPQATLGKHAALPTFRSWIYGDILLRGREKRGEAVGKGTKGRKERRHKASEGRERGSIGTLGTPLLTLGWDGGTFKGWSAVLFFVLRVFFACSRLSL